MTIPVHHMSGAGNLFVMLDGRGSNGNDRHAADVNADTIQSLIPSLCDRSALKMNNAEGVIVLNDCGPGSATSTFYNPDGSTGAMCGNGGRCLVRFALDNGTTIDTQQQVVFSMAGTVFNATVSENGIICVDFPPPIEERVFLADELPELPMGGTYVNVGSDHVVIDARRLPDNTIDLSDLALVDIALPIRYSAEFERGTNVNIATIVDRKTVRMRTYERGVEGETGACGTGAISTAIALWRAGNVDDSVRIVPSSGKELRAVIHHHDNAIRRVTLCGDAVYDAEPSQFDISSGQYL